MTTEVMTYRPAKEAWERHREGIVRSFSAFKGDMCPKMLLIGSVSLDEDDDGSDIDIAILTGGGFSFFDASRIIRAIKSENPCGVKLHIVFFPIGMEEKLVEDGGLIICQ